MMASGLVAPGPVMFDPMMSRPLPVPGPAEQAAGSKSGGEVIHLGSQPTHHCDAGAYFRDPAERIRVRVFVFIGQRNPGTGALADPADNPRNVRAYYPVLRMGGPRWVLVEATERILPEVSPALGRYTQKQPERRGVERRLNIRVRGLRGAWVGSDDGTARPAGTVVWQAWARAHPTRAHVCPYPPLDDQGRPRADPVPRVPGAAWEWTTGARAAVPDLTRPAGSYTGAPARPAVRQARGPAGNPLAVRPPIRPYRHRRAGSLVSPGPHRRLAEIYAVKPHGWPARFMHRTYRLSRLPTFDREARAVADRTPAPFLPREIVSLGSFAGLRVVSRAPPRQRPRVPTRPCRRAPRPAGTPGPSGPASRPRRAASTARGPRRRTDGEIGRTRFPGVAHVSQE
jgi:NADH dehydrogenase